MIEEGSAAGMGPELDKGYLAVQWNSPLDEDGNPIPTELVSHKNNVENFAQTGITSTNNVSIANNNETINYRVGFTNLTNRGIIPNTDYFRNNLSLSSDLNATKNLIISTDININRSWSNEFSSQ